MNAHTRSTLISLSLAACFALQGASGQARPQTGGQTATPEIDRKVEALLQQMTVEEKVGQMTQVTIDVVSAGKDGRQEPHTLDPAKLEKAVLSYHVGSILNVGPKGYSIDHWENVITQIQDVATKKSRLKIPVLYGIDAVHGANYTDGATLFPQGISMAATWNPEVARRAGEITSHEVKASRIPWNFYPVLDLGRQPLWPRLWETFGEDVLVSTVMGKAYIEGAQGKDMSAPDKLAVCLKHYVGYSFPLSGKDRTPAWISERMMREYFLPPFEAAVKAGSMTVMVNSAEVNGIPGHANYHLLTEVLKDEWGFQGFVVSDWADIERLNGRDKVAATPKEAVKLAVMAGVDMSMVPLDFSFYDHLVALVKEGSVPMERIDDAVRRILRVKFMVGLFEKPYGEPSLSKAFASEEHTAANRAAAQESIILLKNDDHVLPLDPSAKVLVTGPTANMLSVLNGGWTITWQGNEESLYPQESFTILEAIQERAGSANVTYKAVDSFTDAPDYDAIVEAAKDQDVLVVCLGEPAYCETPGNINDLTLDESQLVLAEKLAQTGKPVVLVLAEGRPRIIRRIVDAVDGIVLGFLPGMEGGHAIADVLYGDVNPSGKLPVTYPRYPNAIVPYDCKVSEVVDGNVYDPEFPFGFGLSYATFEYSNLVVTSPVYGMDEPIVIHVDVKNTGDRAGKEVVQLYVSDLYRSVTPPVRQLEGFSKVDLQPGETRTVTFTLSAPDLSFIGLDNTRIVEPGMFAVTVDSLRQQFELR